MSAKLHIKRKVETVVMIRPGCIRGLIVKPI